MGMCKALMSDNFEGQKFLHLKLFVFTCEGLNTTKIANILYTNNFNNPFKPCFEYGIFKSFTHQIWYSIET